MRQHSTIHLSMSIGFDPKTSADRLSPAPQLAAGGSVDPGQPSRSKRVAKYTP